MTDEDPFHRRASVVPAEDEMKHLAYGEAALMLVEILMLTLLEQRVLAKDQLVAAVESVIETKRQMMAGYESPEVAAIAAGVLRTLANSLAAAD